MMGDIIKNSKIWGVGMLKSIGLSFKNMFRGPITVQYPFERLEEFPNSRWAVELVLDEEGQHKCTACLACMKACSHHCIDIDVTTAEDRSKTINYWRYEVGACINCGLCTEACNFDAIHMNHDYELAEFTREDMVRTLIAKQPAAKPKRPDKPAGAAAKAAEEKKAAAAEAARKKAEAKKDAAETFEGDIKLDDVDTNAPKSDTAAPASQEDNEDKDDGGKES